MNKQEMWFINLIHHPHPLVTIITWIKRYASLIKIKSRTSINNKENIQSKSKLTITFLQSHSFLSFPTTTKSRSYILLDHIYCFIERYLGFICHKHPFSITFTNPTTTKPNPNNGNNVYQNSGFMYRLDMSIFHAKQH